MNSGDETRTFYYNVIMCLSCGTQNVKNLFPVLKLILISETKAERMLFIILYTVVHSKHVKHSKSD